MTWASVSARCPAVAWHDRLVVDVSLDRASGRGEPVLILVKLQSPTWELNVRATPEELARLAGIRDADWAARRSLHVGESAGSAVHWSATGDTVTVMVGADDETWDFALMIPVATVDSIVSEAATARW
jgi:hypothetical protein